MWKGVSAILNAIFHIIDNIDNSYGLFHPRCKYVLIDANVSDANKHVWVQAQLVVLYGSGLWSTWT